MKISVITPTYNSAKYIEETISSIQNQTYKNFEHIVIDGLSTDNTVEIIKKYNNIKYISEKDKGQSDALNKGFKLATGDILAWQNADDLYFPHTFSKVVDFFTKNPHVGLVYGYYENITEDGRVLSKIKPIEWNRWLFKHGRFVPLQPTVFWRRNVYEIIGDLDINLHYCMDVDFFSRACKKFGFALIPEPLGKFRVHKESKTQNKNNNKRVKNEHKYVLSKNFRYTYFNSIVFEVFYFRSLISSKIKKG